jgi:hypothetical protein
VLIEKYGQDKQRTAICLEAGEELRFVGMNEVRVRVGLGSRSGIGKSARC